MMDNPVVGGLLLILGAIYGFLLNLLSWLFALLYLLVSPLLYLLHGLLKVALFPLQILIKFEAFLYFVTGAVITGVTVGLFLHFTGDALSELLRLQSSPSPSPKDEPALKTEPIDWQSKWDHQLLSSTIPEEEENSSA
ncbi:uncharacterized protein N7484_001590 [Penicillium longicatenatum]|uniref:uncharacterized protein n=1 Tax=Penicillium longicatenatum TaxID=1561947 RepID=UPI0025469A07|nr:uncharacterized protein N7484_001590 [Penicillium longicatenatum]KAJ5657941.1 hypothetical protein N7484_001590 [Penicillium longicatenatum]